MRIVLSNSVFMQIESSSKSENFENSVLLEFYRNQIFLIGIVAVCQVL